MISYDDKSIYMRVPKVASSTMKSALRDLGFQDAAIFTTEAADPRVTRLGYRAALEVV